MFIKAHIYGEVIVFSIENEKIKFPGSDTVSILASLPLFTQDDKEVFLTSALTDTNAFFNQKAKRLLQEIKKEKPAFKDEIKKEDINECFFGLSQKSNKRIIKQDGAFIICGLFDENKNPVNKYRYTKNNIKQLYIIKPENKRNILKQLSNYSINKASLFPEISDVAEFIKSQN